MIQVRIVLEGADKFSNLIGSLYYPHGDSPVDLSLELLKNVRVFLDVGEFVVIKILCIF